MFEYLPVLPIQPMSVGQSWSAIESLPPHCTLVHWFRCGTGFDAPLLEDVLMRLAAEVEEDYIELVSEQPALFGPNYDITAHMLERNPALLLLHTKLLITLAKWDCRFKELRWVGAGYNPHTTDNGLALRPGFMCRAGHLALVRRDESRRKEVVGVYRFGKD